MRTESLIQRGKASFERRDYVSALTDFRVVLDAHPEFVDVRHLAGLCLSFLGQPEAALEQFDAALAQNPEYGEAHLNRAITLNELGRYEEAREAFAAAARQETAAGERFPAALLARLALAHAAVGDLYLAADAPAEAAEQYNRALGLRPRFVDLREKLAQALIRLDDLDGAEAALRDALAVNPGFLSARLALGFVHFRRGDRESAAREWGICRESDADHPQLRAYLAMLARPVAEEE